jgi:RNA recognition motif-containing protein
MNLFVGNLPRQASEDDIKEAFAGLGEITSIRIIKDKFSGESKGFAFVEMTSKAEGEAAIRTMDGKPFMGQRLTVNEARPKPEGGQGGGGFRGGSSGGGGGYRGGGGSGSGGGGRRSY